MGNEMATTIDAPERMFGKAIKRREDPRLITGAAAYLEDVRLVDVAHAAVLRSPHGHARIVSIDVDYEPLPTVVDARKATLEDAPQLHENAPNNVVLTWSCGRDAETVGAA